MSGNKATGRPRRKRGTGQIVPAKSGNFAAYHPGSREPETRIGDFPTYEEAEAAIDQWLADHPDYHPPASPGRPGNNAAKAVQAYLEEIRLHHLGEAGSSRYIGIGRVPGLPASTTDPEVAEKAASYWIERAAVEPNILKELELRSKAHRLRDEAEALRKAPDLRAAFVEHAGQWGKERGIQWGTWRDMGVPASVLREAGITP